LRRKVDYYNLEKHLIMEWFLFCHILMIIKWICFGFIWSIQQINQQAINEL
jgi:hypothetical protein